MMFDYVSGYILTSQKDVNYTWVDFNFLNKSCVRRSFRKLEEMNETVLSVISKKKTTLWGVPKFSEISNLGLPYSI